MLKCERGPIAIDPTPAYDAPLGADRQHDGVSRSEPILHWRRMATTTQPWQRGPAGTMRNTHTADTRRFDKSTQPESFAHLCDATVLTTEELL
jgi:hypothetical protein